MKSTLILLAALALSSVASAQSVVLSDFSNFTPSAYFFSFSGAWSEDTAHSGATSFSIGDFGSGAPTAANGNGFYQWLGSTPQDWSQISYANLTGASLADNAATSIEFYVEDVNGSWGLTSFNLVDFVTLTTVSKPIDFGAADRSAIAFWGFHTSSFDDPAPAVGFTFDNVSVSAAVIPEPSTYAALLGGVVGVIALCRRLRAKKA